MEKQLTVDNLKTTLAPCFAANHVVRARLYGSYARGDCRADSDLNLLVDFGGDATLLDLGGLHEDLQEVLGGMKIGLMTGATLERQPPAFIDSVLKHAVTIYEIH